MTGGKFVLVCPQRGCMSDHLAGAPVPKLCPVCRNPLPASAVQVETGAKPPRVTNSRARGGARSKPGSKGSAKAPADSYGGTD